MTRIRSWSLAAAAALAVACHRDDGTLGPAIAAGLASCGTTQAPFTVAPLGAAYIGGWVPLGNLNPPAHTFPTDHQYLYLNAAGNAAGELPLVAPGDMYVTMAKVTHYGTSGDDYAVTFAPCREVVGEFGHVRSLAPALTQQIGAFDQECNTYSPAPGQSVTQCYSRNVAVKLKAGDAMGTAAGLDLSLFDSRIAPLTFANPARWQVNSTGIDHFHVVPFSDYYAEPMRTAIRAMLGQFDGKVRRTAEPVGGTIATDVAGTVQGTWFNAAQPTYPESPHLALVPDNVDPTIIDLSFGTSQPGFASNAYRMHPAASGAANRAPSQITPGSTVDCWDILPYFGTGTVGRLLLQLTDATTLVTEVQTTPGTCLQSQPWSFTPSRTFTYKR